MSSNLIAPVQGTVGAGTRGGAAHWDTDQGWGEPVQQEHQARHQAEDTSQTQVQLVPHIGSLEAVVVIAKYPGHVDDIQTSHDWLSGSDPRHLNWTQVLTQVIYSRLITGKWTPNTAVQITTW